MSQVEAEQGTGPTGHDNPLRLLHLHLHPRLGKPSQTQTITRQQLPTRGRAASMFDGPPPLTRPISHSSFFGRFAVFVHIPVDRV